MTVLDTPPRGCPVPAPVGRRACTVACSTPSRDLIETTELRWFEAGAVPPAVSTWFTRGGGRGMLEERTDLYRIDGRVDVGVKLRARSILEVKIRQSSTAMELPAAGVAVGPRGVLEVWRKRRPDDAGLSDGPEAWVVVSKMILKRRFSIAGDELPVSGSDDPPDRAFCDVEIVDIDAASGRSWSFAFAAQGPPSGRRASLAAAWRALVSVPPPGEWLLGSAMSFGYPEWLERRIDREDSTFTP
jgi:hypothetical protein